MKTPICDFVKHYAESGTRRFHMPGHKGVSSLGLEHLDITEVVGADSLYDADGIIGESERNASEIFDCPTFYSTEGSSQCIRAMLYLVILAAKEKGKTPLVLAGRNAHKTFLSAAALLGFDVEWLFPTEKDSYLSCTVDADALEKRLTADEKKPTAVYLTSPDYLGSVADIRAIAEVCHRHGVLLCVDNAHGAYLKFLSPSRHPIDLGADVCCDSAHKTLPVLTGGAYLHLAKAFPATRTQVKAALSLFGSTSPSYLILQSLDAQNPYLHKGFSADVAAFLPHVEELSQHLTAHGYSLVSDEPLKITIRTKSYGYTGTDLAELLRQNGIECEFADPDFLVFMLSPAIGVDALRELEQLLTSLPRRNEIKDTPPQPARPQVAMTIRDAMLSPCEILPVRDSVGRILAAATVSCPPAIPIVVSGEIIDESALACFDYYGIDTCNVIK